MSATDQPVMAVRIVDSSNNVLETLGGASAPLELTETVGASALTLTGATQTSSFPVLTMTQTWNNAGTTFTAVKLDVTSTASATASLLLDLKVGGTTKFSIDKSGHLLMVGRIGKGTASTDPAIRFTVTGSPPEVDIVTGDAGGYADLRCNNVIVGGGTITGSNSRILYVGTSGSGAGIGLGVLDVTTSFVKLPAGTTARSSLMVTSGVAPTSPVEGDLWYDGTNLKFRDSTTSRTINWT